MRLDLDCVKLALYLSQEASEFYNGTLALGGNGLDNWFGRFGLVPEGGGILPRCQVAFPHDEHWTSGVREA